MGKERIYNFFTGNYYLKHNDFFMQFLSRDVQKISAA